MRKLMIALAATAAILIAGTLAWKAEAAIWGAATIGTAAHIVKPGEPAACFGPGGRCRWGRHWVCGPYGRRCWCAPC
jgi:hypothetical protein